VTVCPRPCWRRWWTGCGSRSSCSTRRLTYANPAAHDRSIVCGALTRIEFTVTLADHLQASGDVSATTTPIVTLVDGTQGEPF